MTDSLMDERDRQTERQTLISNKTKEKTMNDKFIYIPNDDKQNNPLCRLGLSITELLAMLS